MNPRHVFLEHVDDRQDILRSLNTFNEEAGKHSDLARSLLVTTSYWVYDPAQKRFGPSKFVGFKDMDFERYAAARKGWSTRVRFHGRRVWKANERVLGSYGLDSELGRELVIWAGHLLWHGVCNTIDKRKWKFVKP
jgi:hypothetical protein